MVASPDPAHRLVEAARATSALEFVAVVFGLTSVYLSTREHISSWPTAIVNVGIYSYLFWQWKWYADAGLQVFYLVLSVYGWYEWLYGGARHSPLAVTRASRADWLVAVPAFVVAAACIGRVLDRYTDSPVPYLDASLTSASLVAQWMMTRKRLENWAIWLVADAVYVPVLLWRGNVFTSLQYAVFLVLAAMGWFSWRRSLRARQQAVTA
jgi:nicotinamide mononucleotide transporter